MKSFLRKLLKHLRVRQDRSRSSAKGLVISMTSLCTSDQDESWSVLYHDSDDEDTLLNSELVDAPIGLSAAQSIPEYSPEIWIHRRTWASRRTISTAGLYSRAQSRSLKGAQTLVTSWHHCPSSQACSVEKVPFPVIQETPQTLSRRSSSHQAAFPALPARQRTSYPSNAPYLEDDLVSDEDEDGDFQSYMSCSTCSIASSLGEVLYAERRTILRDVFPDFLPSPPFTPMETKPLPLLAPKWIEQGDPRSPLACYGDLDSLWPSSFTGWASKRQEIGEHDRRGVEPGFFEVERVFPHLCFLH